jgi:hypothetical protein
MSIFVCVRAEVGERIWKSFVSTPRGHHHLVGGDGLWGCQPAPCGLEASELAGTNQ